MQYVSVERAWLVANMLQLGLLLVVCGIISPLGVNSDIIRAYGNEADNDSNIIWGPLPPRKEYQFPTDTHSGRSLIGLYTMVNGFIDMVQQPPFDYGKSNMCLRIVSLYFVIRRIGH